MNQIYFSWQSKSCLTAESFFTFVLASIYQSQHSVLYELLQIFIKGKLYDSCNYYSTLLLSIIYPLIVLMQTFSVTNSSFIKEFSMRWLYLQKEIISKKSTKQQKQEKTPTKALSCPSLSSYLCISLLSQHPLWSSRYCAHITHTNLLRICATETSWKDE